MENKEQLGKILFHIARLHATRADQFMDKIDLYRGQGMLIKFLSRHDGLTHSEIAEKLAISPAAATKVIKRLEEQDYLQRRPDPRDERISRVFILPAGVQVAEEIENIFMDLDKNTFQGFSDEELQQLHGFLKRMQENLLKNFPDPIPDRKRPPHFHRHF